MLMFCEPGSLNFPGDGGWCISHVREMDTCHAVKDVLTNLESAITHLRDDASRTYAPSEWTAFVEPQYRAILGIVIGMGYI